MVDIKMRSSSQSGFSMIEVLITIFILVIGLLGLSGLQSRLQVSEVESYQRAQALVLLNDMANRLSANRNNAAKYVTLSALGTDIADCTTIDDTIITDSTSDPTTLTDAIEWCNAIKGAAETSGGSSVGAMIGGRGCIQNIGTGQYMITVAWQGLTDISTPPASVTCGVGSYLKPGSTTVNDAYRRTITTIVRIADLAA